MDPAQDRDFTGHTVGHYSIVALIATGGQGRVYRGRDRRLRRDVALKVLTSRCQQQPVERRRLILEARALSRLNHQHIAGVYDFLTEGGRDFMVMEFVSGATLRDILAGGPLPPAEVVRLGAQLARGLAAAHAANVVHCDVKPGNIKITSSGELKILDFGLATLLPAGVVPDSETRTSTGPVRGTVPYMSPEQLRGEKADQRSDIFSTGLVLYEMATGTPAFPQRSLAQLVDAIQHVDPLPPSAVNPLVPGALEDVILKAMHKDPWDRPASAIDVAVSLETLLPNRGTSSWPREFRVPAGALATGGS